MSGPTPSRLLAVQVGSGWFPEAAGGLNRYYFDLLRALPDAGVDRRGLVVGSHDVEADSGGSVRAYAPADVAIWKRWRAGRRAVRQAWSDVPATRPALLATHFAAYAYPLARPPGGRPWVVHFHGPWAAESRREGGGRLATAAKKYIEQAVYRRADRFVVLSDAFRRVLCDGYDIDPARVNVVPGGVDIARFATAFAAGRADARGRMGWPADRPIVLAVRRLASRMGLEKLIDAMADVRRRVPDALCLIAGRGRLEADLRGRITAAGLADSVRLLGFVADDDLPWAYRAADVSVMPSEALEGFGLSAVESLAAGTPVLVSPVGGLPEVVRSLDAALVLDDVTRVPLADALAVALGDPSSLPSAGECRRYATRFDWPIIAGRVADVYRQAVAGR